MATLQKIRSKGPLVVIVIGLALFAFIAGDAWKVLQPHQGKQEVGEVNGQTIAAQDYQKEFEELSNVFKTMRGGSSFTEEELNYIKDQTWQQMVTNNILETEAKKLGIAVTDDEIKAVVEAGTNPLLAQTPFRNAQTGAFDKDMLTNFLAEYANMSKMQLPEQYREYYEQMASIWRYTEKALRQQLMATKYQSLITKSIFANKVGVENAFNERKEQAEAIVASYPFVAFSDSTIKVSDADIKSLYNERKEQYRQLIETRNIKYVDVQVKASDKDKEELINEMNEYASQMADATDKAAFVRAASSTIKYGNMAINKEAYPADVASRIEGTAVNEVVGPYYNEADDTYNIFQILATATLPDDIKYQTVSVPAEKADSVFAVLQGGSDFATVAHEFGQNEEPQTLAAAQFEGAVLDENNILFVKTLFTAEPNTVKRVEIGSSQVIYKVLERNNMKTKYDVAIIKRPVEFSKETYTQAYNDFSQFVAQNSNINDLEANAEESGYRLLERADLMNSEHIIGGVQNTRDALKWVFTAKEGEVSPLYECGTNDHLMVVALESINPVGFRKFELAKDELGAELQAKMKAEKIKEMLNGKSIADVAAIENVKLDTIKQITFSAPVYVTSIYATEPALSAHISKAEVNQVSAPVIGKQAVYVFQVLNKGQNEEAKDDAAEATKLTSTLGQYASTFMQDLFRKANIKDNRYLWF